jgi:hypothetical protein
MTPESIFFKPDWVMTRYKGWRTMHRDTHCLMLTKGRFPLRRVCILSTLPAVDFFTRYDLAQFRDGKTLLTLKIIPMDDAAVPFARSQGLLPTADAQRMFHKFTFIIDLNATTDQLWMAMRPTNRNLCKKAEHAGIRVRVESAPTGADIDHFFHLYSEMARLRGLTIPLRSMLMKMFADQQLILVCAEQESAVLSMALIYVAGDAAMYLYGVSTGRSGDGAGQLLQWNVIQTLKSRGTKQYDLGGVPRIDESDGIFKFKKGFGGQGVALGPEFCRAPVWFQLMRRVRSWLQRRHS